MVRAKQVAAHDSASSPTEIQWGAKAGARLDISRREKELAPQDRRPLRQVQKGWRSQSGRLAGGGGGGEHPAGVERKPS